MRTFLGACPPKCIYSIFKVIDTVNFDSKIDVIAMSPNKQKEKTKQNCNIRYTYTQTHGVAHTQHSFIFLYFIVVSFVHNFSAAVSYAIHFDSTMMENLLTTLCRSIIADFVVGRFCLLSQH